MTEKFTKLYHSSVKVFGLTESAYLQYIMDWISRSKRTDGYVYKSKLEIQEDLNLSPKRQDGIRKKLESTGVLKTKLIKAGGAPTLHYGVDRERLAELLENDKTAQSSGNRKNKDRAITQKVTMGLSRKGINPDYVKSNKPLHETTTVDYKNIRTPFIPQGENNNFFSDSISPEECSSGNKLPPDAGGSADPELPRFFTSFSSGGTEEKLDANGVPYNPEQLALLCREVLPAHHNHSTIVELTRACGKAVKNETPPSVILESARLFVISEHSRQARSPETFFESRFHKQVRNKIWTGEDGLHSTVNGSLYACTRDGFRPWDEFIEETVDDLREMLNVPVFRNVIAARMCLGYALPYGLTDADLRKIVLLRPDNGWYKNPQISAA